MLTGAALLLILSLAAGDPWVLPTQAATWAAVGYLVLFGSVVMFALFVYTLQRWTASAVSYVTLLMPMVTVVLAAVLTGERITPSFAAGRRGDSGWRLRWRLLEGPAGALLGVKSPGVSPLRCVRGGGAGGRDAPWLGRCGAAQASGTNPSTCQ